VIEIAAAAVASAITVAAMATGSSIKRSSESNEALVRLTVGLESISTKLEQLHVDIRSDRKEMFGRISELEVRVTRLEVRDNENTRG
jgi:hypothetical protein